MTSKLPYGTERSYLRKPILLNRRLYQRRDQITRRLERNAIKHALKMCAAALLGASKCPK